MDSYAASGRSAGLVGTASISAQGRCPVSATATLSLSYWLGPAVEESLDQIHSFRPIAGFTDGHHEVPGTGH